MASFQAKIRRETLRTGEIKKLQKKFKKLEKTVMASFQAKIGWKWPRKRQKYKLSFRFVPTQCVIENSKQIAKKYKKL